MRRTDNFSKFQDLRNEYPYFSYDSYRYKFSENSLEINYSFNLSNRYFFTPRISIPYKNNIFLPFDNLSAKALNNLVFHAGMIEMISYWKAACPPKVLIKPHKLSDDQVKFWKKIYFLGLGEFFYLNSIQANEDDFMELNCGDEDAVIPFPATVSAGSLIPVGGGKDSAVTMGIFNKSGENWLPLVINPRNATRDVIRASGKNQEETVEIFREIHPGLLKLNKEGFLNGHTPFSALLAFYSLLAAFLTGRSDIVLSNESSANEATVPGTSINHQYSKSIGFEQDFRSYTGKYISPGFNYFSLLRPLSELQIARLFSEMPEYLGHFKSCNVGSKTDTWCGACPKCLFTFIILSPFLEPEVMTGIFGKNLLDDPSLDTFFGQLTGREEIKPFECIGTVGEVNLALKMATKMYINQELPYLLRKYRQQPDPGLSGELPPDLSGDHCIPPKYISLLVKALK